MAINCECRATGAVGADVGCNAGAVSTDKEIQKQKDANIHTSGHFPSCSSQARKLAFYVSSHGFGHATRAAHVVKAILGLPRKHSVWIVTGAPEFIFKDLTCYPDFHYRQIDLDAGVVQVDVRLSENVQSATAY